MPESLEFIYEQDFDENGALFFLGSYGKTRAWQNPHSLGQVQAFASSVGNGAVSDIVGRKLSGVRTLNEAFSFFGIDLGEGRRLLPTCYTLMNRNSTTHVLMNWHIEGSNDKVNWTILDRRVYLPAVEEGVLGVRESAMLEQEQKALRLKGATNTWAIDMQVYDEIGEEGF